MGPKISLQMHPDSESVTEPGKKALISDGLEDYCTYERLFEQVLGILREPLYPMESYILKTLSVTEDGPGEFTVKVFHDADRLQSFGWSKPDGTDRLRLWLKCWYSLEKREIITEEFHEEGHSELRTTTRFLENPLRIEFWCDHCSGERRTGRYMAWIVKHQYIVPSIKFLMKRKVHVCRCVNSVSGDGPSCISDGLDEYMTRENLMQHVLDILKNPKRHGVGKSEFIETSEYDFEVRTECLPQNPDEGGVQQRGVSVVTQCRGDPELGQVLEVASVGNELLHTAWLKIHRDPLRLEYWIEDSRRPLADGPEHERQCSTRRLAGRLEHLVLQEIVDTVVRKAEGLDGWFF